MTLLVLLIAVALAFDFMNGRNDAANSIATIVSTRVLSPRAAVAWAAFFNFVAFMVFGLNVASTIGKGIISPEVINDHVIMGALAGAISWQVVTGYFGIPSSSSHALIGGLVGAGVTQGGMGAIVWPGLGKTAGAIVLSPLTGMVIALLLVLAVSWGFMRVAPHRADAIFRKVQFISASAYALGHGGNDAQKTMGIITALLYAHGELSGDFHVPFWVIVSCNGAMALGTYLGGWRIVRTMGSRITRLSPMQGVCAETAGSITLFMATGLGIPVSTTQTITGAIVGVGAARRASAVRWNVAREIVVAWVITMPAAALIGAAISGLSRMVW
ncbi:MAG: inorganic phosphate transporter [Rhodospirillaceae bacterium]|nr:inorganic phosphate transporter [Rhodospirillaceae bacterium]